MKGKSYNHAVRGNKLFQQAFLHLLWLSFAQWLKQSKNEEKLAQLDVYENMISEKVHICKEMVEMPVLQENLQHLLQDMPKLQKLMKACQ